MRRTVQKISVKGIELMGTILHGVLVLIVFWVAIDLVQQHVATGPQRPGFVGVALAPLKSPELQTVEIRARDYGYFKTHQAPVVVAQAPRPHTDAPKKVVAKARVAPKSSVPLVRVESPVLPVTTQKPVSCQRDTRGNVSWAPWCQTSAKSL